ncbi:MAG: AcvB/VirJ family lysyl-phosphatidylglycerol hydrolase [Vicinamibacterales bacterium]
MTHPHPTSLLLAVTVALSLAATTAAVQPTRQLVIRGQAQTLRLYGPATGAPVIVTSGDGGWMHLAPHVAERLAAAGFAVVGFDSKAYLSSFTSGSHTLGTADEPGDYKALVDFAGTRAGRKPILVGVSEGAGLSVLAATDPQTKAAIGGVIALGLPELSELGWRWKDSIIYLTHGVPNEPTFEASALVGKVAPVPLVAIHSTHDEFVPVDQIRKIMANAREPKQLWLVPASDHGFSDNEAAFDQRLLEAMAWVDAHAVR